MKLLRWLLIFACLPVFGQAARYQGNVYTVNASAPQPGGLYPVLASTTATVQICTYSTTQTCPSLATTYTNASQATSCPTTAQLTPSNSVACTASVDAEGGFGAWLAAGNYQYMVTTSYGTFGPYDFTVGGGGSSGVASLNTLTGALTLTIQGYTCTPSGTTLGCTETAGITITSFTGCSGSEELGQTVSSPTCTVTYTGSPTSAVITNTDSVDSPLTLSSPFTSGTISGTLSHSSIATTTVTVTAQPGSVVATQNYTWNPRIFNGTGTSGGATGATASGTTAVLVGDTGTLPSAQLGAETVGTTFVYTGLTGQYVYMLLTGGSHTFVDANNGFPFAVNSPTHITFVNQYGVSVSMYIYQSVNALTGNFSPRVAS